MGSRRATGTTYSWSTPWWCTSAPPPFSTWGRRAWRRRCPPSPTPRTWTFSKIWQWTWTRKAGTYFWIALPTNCGILTAIRNTSHAHFCTCSLRPTKSRFRNKLHASYWNGLLSTGLIHGVSYLMMTWRDFSTNALVNDDTPSSLWVFLWRKLLFPISFFWFQLSSSQVKNLCFSLSS